MNYHLDFETFCEADLKTVGAHRYARDPSCEVLCLAVSRGHEKPLLWVPPAYQHQLSFIDPLEQLEAQEVLVEMVADETNLIYAHNASFEYVIWNQVMVKRHKFRPLNPRQMRCTASMARRACIPHSLEKCAAYLQLGQKKDARGSTLIRKFSILQKPDKTHGTVWRRFPQDDPAAFKEFCEYCVQDVRTEQEVEKALKLFDVGGISHAAFVYDLIINDEGFPVDIEALKAASQMIDNELDRVRGEFIKLTGLNPTQTEAVTIWLRERGYQGEDLRAATMDEEIEKWEPWTSTLEADALKALELRRVMSYAATKKVKSMLELAGPDDNRVRGTLFYHGASTGRWSSKLVQQQNMKRSTDESEAAFHDLRQGLGADTLELIHGPILETVASGIRHFINDGDHPLDSVDYAAIEARIVCWLAGQEDALDEFTRKVDRYKTMAARIFKIRPEDVTKPQRFLGKQSVLGCGYGMGASKFIGTCASYGQEVSAEVAELAVGTFRDTHKQVVSLWYSLEGACKRAINSPGQKIKVGKHLTVFCMTTAGKRFLMIRLPSGRHLSFPEPRIETKFATIKDEFASAWGKPAQTYDRLTFYGQVPGKAIWGRIETYGGKLVENCLTGDMQVLTQEGWIPLSSLRTQKVHDGVGFVEHGGLLRKGWQDTISHLGFTATADHKFLTTDLQWKSLSCVQANEVLLLIDEKRINYPIQAAPFKTSQLSRPKIRTSFGDVICLRRWEDMVAHAMRLWGNLCQARGRTPKGGIPRANPVLLAAMPTAQSQTIRKKDTARDDKTSSIRSMAFHEAAMFGCESPSLQKLWGTGNQCLRRVGELVCSILGGYGRVLGKWDGLRSHRQQCGLLQIELPLGHTKSQYQQSEGKCGQHRDIRCSQGERNKSINSVLAIKTRRENRVSSDEKARCQREVFDIRNCGKRNRFLVKSPTSGLIAVAHNCTQAVAADVMTMGTANAIKAGHKVVMLVHDEAVRLTRGSQHDLDHFIKCLLDMPEWASGLPLDAEGATIPFYKK